MLLSVESEKFSGLDYVMTKKNRKGFWQWQYSTMTILDDVITDKTRIELYLEDYKYNAYSKGFKNFFRVGNIFY